MDNNEHKNHDLVYTIGHFIVCRLIPFCAIIGLGYLAIGHQRVLYGYIGIAAIVAVAYYALIYFKEHPDDCSIDG